MKIKRIASLMLRHFYLIKASLPRIVDLIYWPTVQIILWGFVSKFFTMHSTYFNNTAGIILSAAIPNALGFGSTKTMRLSGF